MGEGLRCEVNTRIQADLPIVLQQVAGHHGPIITSVLSTRWRHPVAREEVTKAHGAVTHEGNQVIILLPPISDSKPLGGENEGGEGRVNGIVCPFYLIETADTAWRTCITNTGAE